MSRHLSPERFAENARAALADGQLRGALLPRVHVALMGIEKVIPRFEGLAVFLRLLPRSGTGQQLTSYQSLLTGPSRDGDEGPRELHVVLLDAGRSRMLAHPLTRAALRCIRCGACLNTCPVYQQVGGHAYGSVYPGPIGAVIEATLAEVHQPIPSFETSLAGRSDEIVVDLPTWTTRHLSGGLCLGAEDLGVLVGGTASDADRVLLLVRVERP